MKFKDYFRLGRLSLKARKKTTSQTVRGLSFGGILLLPVVFLALSFYIDLNKQVNKFSETSTFSVPLINELTSSKEVISMYKGYEEDVLKSVECENALETQTFYFDHINSSDLSKLDKSYVTIDNVTKNIPFLKSKDQYSTETRKHCIQFVKPLKNDMNIFFKMDGHYSKNPLIAGEGFSFSKSNRGKLIISSMFFEREYGEFTTDIINKKITLSTYYRYGSGCTPSSNPTKIESTFPGVYGAKYNIFDDYEIVGIFDANIYKSTVRAMNIGTSIDEDTSSPIDIPLFIMTYDSLYNDGGKNFLPNLINYEDSTSSATETKALSYYPSMPQEMDINSKNDNIVFLPMGFGVNSQASIRLGNTNNTSPEYKNLETCLLISYKDYSTAQKAAQIINGLTEKSVKQSVTEKNIYIKYASDTYESYSAIYKVFTYVIIGFSLFGGIIFFATCLNLYNTIYYSVESRTNYLGLLRAIGLRGKDVTKQYFIENSIIFGRTMIFTTVIGGGLCVGIKFAIDIILKKSTNISALLTGGLNLSLNLVYLPIALGVILCLFLIVDVLSSLMACKKVANAPILELLTEEK